MGRPNSELSISAHLITNYVFISFHVFFNLLMQNRVAAADQGVHPESVQQDQERLCQRDNLCQEENKGTMGGQQGVKST